MIEENITKRIKIPCQKKLHRKQCLQDNAEENQNNTPDDEGDFCTKY